MFKNNKKNVKIVALAIAAAFLFGVAGLAVSQTTQVASAAPASNVGKVNYQMLVQQHPDLAKVQTTMQTESEAAKKEFDAKAASLGEKEKQEYFMQLQQRITSLENGIADRRELYNEAVNINNVRVEQFPDSLIAGLFRFEQKPLLEFSANEKADVDMKQLFS